MAEIKNILFGFALIGAVVIATSIIIANMGYLYSVDTTDISGLNSEEFVNTLYQMNQSVRGVWEAITPQRSGITVSDIFELFGVFTHIKNLIDGVIFTPFKLILNIITNVLNIPYWVTIIIGVLLFLFLILAIFKFLKVGE